MVIIFFPDGLSLHPQLSEGSWQTGFKSSNSRDLVFGDSMVKHLEGRKPVSTPRDRNQRLSKDQCIVVEPGKDTAFPFMSMVGALLYLSLDKQN